MLNLRVQVALVAAILLIKNPDLRGGDANLSTQKEKGQNICRHSSNSHRTLSL